MVVVCNYDSSCCRVKIAYAAEVTMGSGGNLIFEPSEITISAGDTVTFVNGELPPHNMIVKDHPFITF